MANVDVIEVESSSLLKKFITYPNQLYKDCPQYVWPLLSERLAFFDTQKNPFYKSARVKLFVAVQEGRVCGRVATCINFKHNDFHGEKVGFFGFFDTPDDFDIAHKLLKTAMITVKKEGMEKMRGPMNFSTNHEIGFLVDGFDTPPSIMMTYNYPYQPKLAEKFGLKKCMDLLAFRITREVPIPERIQNVVDKMQQRSEITLRQIRMSEFEAEVKRINEIYNQAWSYNWGFVPMDEEEFAHTARDMKKIFDPDLVFIAEHKGRPVAFSLALPDFNQALIHLKGRLLPFGLLKLLWHTKIKNKIDSLRFITFGVIPEFQKRAVDSLMYIHSYRKGVEKGYYSAEISWVLETNELMCRAAEQMGAKYYKKYRIMEMPL
ncbi:MAG: N-acetyltransferase [Candidatus Zixiibacteriota bacterium]